MERRRVSHLELSNEGKQVSLTDDIDESLNVVRIKIEPDLDLNDGDSDDTYEWKCLNEEKSTTTSNRRNKLNDGQTTKKLKTKGKRRYRNPYMVYAKDVRPQILSENPNLDHISICRKISQLWANLSKDEKDNWHMKTKRLRLANLADFLDKKSIEAGALSDAK